MFIVEIFLILAAFILGYFTDFGREFFHAIHSRKWGEAMRGVKNSWVGLTLVIGILAILFTVAYFVDNISQNNRETELINRINENTRTSITDAIDRQTQAIINAIQQGGQNVSDNTTTTK